MLQTGRQSSFRDPYFQVAIFNVLSKIQQLTCTCLFRTNAGVFLDAVFFNGRHFYVHIVCTCGTGGILDGSIASSNL